MSNLSINPAGQQPKLPDNAGTLAKGLGLSEKTNEITKQALSILGNAGIKILNADVRTDSTGTPTGPTGTPVLDNPDDQAAVEANLERLIAFLQLDNDERQAQMAQERIEVLKNSLKTEHEGRAAKIQKSLDDMKKAHESQTRNKIFGWLMAAIAVIAAVVACVATGGLATGAVIAAGIAVTCQILNETGVMEKLTDKIAEGLEKLGMSKDAAKIVAQIAVTVAIVAACIASGNIGGVAGNVSAAVKAAVDVLRPIVSMVSGVMGGLGLVSGVVGAVDNYRSGMSEADVKETEKFIAALRQKLEESEEELQQILEMIQNFIGQLADLLASSTDTSEEIAGQIGQMA